MNQLPCSQHLYLEGCKGLLAQFLEGRTKSNICPSVRVPRPDPSVGHTLPSPSEGKEETCVQAPPPSLLFVPFGGLVAGVRGAGTMAAWAGP